MSELREYRVILNGTETTALLNDADALRLGAVLIDAPAPAATAPVEPAAKARVVPNMARAPQTKDQR